MSKRNPADGFKAGDHIQDIANLWKDNPEALQETLIFTTASMGDAETNIDRKVIDYDFTIKKVRAFMKTAAATSTATLAHGTLGSETTNPIAATNIDMNGLTTQTPAVETLTSTAADLNGSTGDAIAVTFATSGGSGSLINGYIAITIQKRFPS